MVKSVFITGGNSGIGREFAIYYAKQGAHIGLAARRIDLLKSVAEEISKEGGTANIYELDVSDRQACSDAANDFIKKAGSIDLVIANAGASVGDRLYGGDSSSINYLFTTNILGTTNTIYPFIPQMKMQKSGHIAIVGSMASSRGMPGKGGYSASKRALRVLAESWRISLKKSGIAVTVFSPGFIDTPFVTKNKYPMPFMISAEEAVKIMTNALNKGAKHLIFPWQWRILSPIISILPDALIGMFVNRDKFEIDKAK